MLITIIKYWNTCQRLLLRMYFISHCLVKPDPCASKPCANEGECIRIGYYNYKCKCVNGYTGDQCTGIITHVNYFIADITCNDKDTVI